jgi:hypothetical protein
MNAETNKGSQHLQDAETSQPNCIDCIQAAEKSGPFFFKE